MLNDRHAEAARRFEVERAIVNEDALFGLALGNRQRYAEYSFLGLAGVDVAGAKKNLEAAAKIESLDPILIQLERLIVDCTHEVTIGGHALIEYGANRGKFLGLGKHERGELFAGKLARAVEERSFEIIVQGELARVKGRKRKLMAVLKVVPIQVEGLA